MLDELFRDLWWLIFPVFGIVVAVLDYFGEQRRVGAVHDWANRRGGSRQ